MIKKAFESKQHECFFFQISKKIKTKFPSREVRLVPLMYSIQFISTTVYSIRERYNNSAGGVGLCGWDQGKINILYKIVRPFLYKVYKGIDSTQRENDVLMMSLLIKVWPCSNWLLQLRLYFHVVIR